MKGKSNHLKSGFNWIDESSVKVFGVLDEFFDYSGLFSAIETKASSKITLNMSGVTRINSCGVREWIRHHLHIIQALFFVDCPSLFIDQVSMIPQFLPKNGTIVSFYCEFECVECSADKQVLFEVGKDILWAEAGYAEPDDLICENCGSSQVFSHDPAVFFAFLKDQKAS